ncbi:PAS domain-containing protein [Streptomyces sp. NRRL F-5135]|uniref:PAS domain-containing protein n=1 Tax=Streptomyces sp. NRRL F-5135 TaxID=1463858 RepID=UPI0004CC1DD5|nr:PAS domain-containing protein [Streptomyces sp. NRRL F-5135]
MSASRSETTDAAGPDGPEPDHGAGAGREDGVVSGGGPAPGAGGDPERDKDEAGADLLASLLDGMDAALFALDAGGVITHWNREAERILGWTAEEAVGRHGFAGWAVRTADADAVQARLMSVMGTRGRQVDEFALLRKDGGRVLLRTQTAAVRGADGKPAGVYSAFSEVHAQIDLERTIALSEALFEEASWGVVLVDVDLRPTVVNGYAARALGAGRTSVLGRPLGELISHGVEELEAALHHVLAEGAPRSPAELWVTLRTNGGEQRRCWRSGFLRLASPLAEEPVPLGVGWMFHDVTDLRRSVQDADRLRFRTSQLHRAGRAAAECEDPMEAATVQLDFALAGFADHALIDLVAGDGSGDPVRLVRAAASPSGGGSGPGARVESGGIPVRYGPGHPALQALDRNGAVRASAPAGPSGPPLSGGAAEENAGRGRSGPAGAGPANGGGGPGAGAAPGALPPSAWAAARQWPPDAVHALCTVLRSRGRSLGVVTFLRGASRPPFERQDAVYAEDVTGRMAGSLDLFRTLSD